jgi:ATP-dependent Clp protease protease subunit
MKALEAKTRGDAGELYIYGAIGADLGYDDSVSAKSVASALDSLKGVRSLSLYLNSPGGSVFDGLAIYNQLRRFPAAKTCFIDGLAASIATVVMMGCDVVEAAPASLLMVHDPSGIAYGTADDLRKAADDMDRFRAQMSALYSIETGIAQDEVEAMMAKETWMTAEEAVDNGFVDRLGSTKAVTAHHPLLARYKHTPEALRATASRDYDPSLLRLAAAAARVRLRRGLETP